jgi:hypothetical protein
VISEFKFLGSFRLVLVARHAWKQAFFDFETTVGIASGVFRVVYLADGSWKAHTVFTNLENLEGFPEQNGPDETTSQTTESGPRSVHVRLNVSTRSPVS